MNRNITSPATTDKPEHCTFTCTSQSCPVGRFVTGVIKIKQQYCFRIITLHITGKKSSWILSKFLLIRDSNTREEHTSLLYLWDTETKVCLVNYSGCIFNNILSIRCLMLIQFRAVVGVSLSHICWEAGSTWTGRQSIAGLTHRDTQHDLWPLSNSRILHTWQSWLVDLLRNYHSLFRSF